MAPMRPLPAVAGAGLLGLAVLLAGCGMGPMAVTSAPVSSAAAISGTVHGGLSPITGASIQLWSAGTGGNGSAATSLLNNTAVLTDANGNFSLTGDYTCPTADTQVYLTSVGGNPGLANNATNAGLVLVSALGRCGDLSSSTYIFMNEVSTAAAVWALAPFFGTGSTPFNTLGASATNSVGLANAFLNARLLAPTATGAPGGLPATLSIESAKLISLANALASCSNSDGTTACAPLYTAATPAGGSAPTNLLAAALNIVRNPGTNVAAVYSTGGTMPPYSGGLAVAPHDWTMTLTLTGGGVTQPYGIGVDRLGNVWTANFASSSIGTDGSVSAFSPQGTALAGSPYGYGALTNAEALVIDRNSDVWVTNRDTPYNGNGNYGSVVKFHGVSSAAAGSTGTLLGQYSDAVLSQPEHLAQDPSGNGTILVASLYTDQLAVFNLDGTLKTDALGSASVSAPGGVVSDGAGGAWVPSYNTGTVVHLNANQTANTYSCCSSPDAIAADRDGNLWIANFSYSNSSVSAVSPAGALLFSNLSGGGIFQPGSLTVDAGNHVWIANLRAADGQTTSTLSELSTAGAVLSPTTGFGLDIPLVQPYQVTLDASGNVWVANSAAANNTTGEQGNVVAFLGLATPTATPGGPIPLAP